MQIAPNCVILNNVQPVVVWAEYALTEHEAQSMLNNRQTREFNARVFPCDTFKQAVDLAETLVH